MILASKVEGCSLSWGGRNWRSLAGHIASAVREQEEMNAGR